MGDVNITNLFKEKYNEFDIGFDYSRVLYDDIDGKCCSNRCKFSHNVIVDEVKVSDKNLKNEQRDPIIFQVVSKNLINGSNSLFLFIWQWYFSCLLTME